MVGEPAFFSIKKKKIGITARKLKKKETKAHTTALIFSLFYTF